MPKSSKENSAVPRVTRTLRNRVVSVDNETSGRTTPTIKKDLESILEDDNKNEQSTTSTQTATPVRGRPRRSSQSEAISTPVKTPARRLTRRTSLSELDNATISSPLRRSTRKISTLAENTIVVEESDEEEDIIIKKQANRSSSKSPVPVSNKNKTAPENVDTKKRGSKGKKSRTPSPLNIFKGIDDGDDNEMNETQSAGNFDKKHNSLVLPTVREVPEEVQQLQKSAPQSSNADVGVKEAKEEKEITMEKRATRSSSKSPSTIKTASGNVEMKKRITKSRSPSPKNVSKITQEKNDEIDKSQPNKDSDKNQNSKVLLSEEVQQSQKFATVDLVKEVEEKVTEIQNDRPASKSPSGLLKKTKTAPEPGDTKKGGSKEKKSRSPSPLNISKTKEENDNQVGESQSSGKSDTNCEPTVLPTLSEDPKVAQQSQKSSPLPEVLAMKENKRELTPNKIQSSSPSKLTVEIADGSTNVKIPMKSPNPIDKEQEGESSKFRRVTRSASKSPVVAVEKNKTEKLNKKIVIDSIVAAAEDKQAVEEPKTNVKFSNEVKKDNLSVIEMKEIEIIKASTHAQSIKEAEKATEITESPKEIISSYSSPVVAVKNNTIPKMSVERKVEEISKESVFTVPLTSPSAANKSTQQSEKGEKGKISFETDIGLTKTANEVLNNEQKEVELFHQSLSMDHNDSDVIMADVNEIIAKLSDDQKEAEKENRKPDGHTEEKNNEVNILDINLDKSVEHTLNVESVENKSSKREESKIEKPQGNNDESFNNAEVSILDKSLHISTKDISNIKHLESELSKCEESIIEHTKKVGKISSKNENINILDISLSKEVEHPPHEEIIFSLSKSSQITNEDTLEESILNKTDLLKENTRSTEKLIEEQMEVNKKQKSVVFDTTCDSEKASANYPKTPIFSKSKSYLLDDDPNSSDDTSSAQKVTSKRTISLDDSKEPEEEGTVEAAENDVNDVAKTDTPLKKMKSATVLSSTPIISSKVQDETGSGSSKIKKNTSLPLGDHGKYDKHGFSKSWSQAVIGKAEDGEDGEAFIDALEHEKKKKERDAIALSKVKKLQKDIKRREAESSEDDEDDDDYEEDEEKDDFLDDEAMEVKEGEESMDSEERRYLEENEVPEHGESIGSEDTEQEEAEECDEENSLDSFIDSDVDRNNELMSVDSAEFSSNESSDEEKVVSKKSFNTSRRIQSSDESDQDDGVKLKTSKSQKLVIESSDEESEDTNEELETEGEMRKESKNLDKRKQQGKEKITIQTIESDTSSSQQGNEEGSKPCSKSKKKQETPVELDEKTNNSIISVESSCMELSIKEVTEKEDEEDSFSTAIDKSQNKNNISGDKTNAEEESEDIESKANDNETQRAVVEQKIPTISPKEIKRRSSLKTISTDKEVESLKENGANAVKNLNSSEETLSATEKTIQSKTLHERANTTNENSFLIKEKVKKATLTNKEIVVADPSDDADIKDNDDAKLHTHEVETEISVKPDAEPLENVQKTKKGKIKNLKTRIFSASFHAVETESPEVEKMSSSFSFIPKKSKIIKDNEEETSQTTVQGEEEDLDCASNIKEQNLLNETYTSELYLDKIFIESDTSQNAEISEDVKEDKKTKKSSKNAKAQKKLQKSSKNYNDDLEEVAERTLEKEIEKTAQITCSIPVNDCSKNSAKSTKAEKRSPDAKETRDFSPIVQILDKSEARLETLIGMKQSIIKKIKKMNIKLQQLYGNNSTKSNELLDENERAIAVALKHALLLLGKQKRKVSRKLQKIDYMQNESESSSEEETDSESEQETQLKTKRKEKILHKENKKDLIPSQSFEEPTTSRPPKRKRLVTQTLAESHEQHHAAYRKTLNFVKTSSGMFVEEPPSPEISKKKKKFKITSTLELPIGVVYEEAVTPTSKKMINGFQETQATPRAVGFKIRNILSAGQKEVPSVKKLGTKRKLDLTESTEVLPKPKWMKSGNFTVKKLKTGNSGYIPLNLNESASTQFMVAPLKSKKSKSSSQVGPSTIKAMEFKARAFSNKQIQRVSSHSILQRKQKLKANQL